MHFSFKIYITTIQFIQFYFYSISLIINYFMQREQNRHNRSIAMDRNHSNIVFDDFSSHTIDNFQRQKYQSCSKMKIIPQKNTIVGQQSVIGSMMKDNIQVAKSTQLKSYRNRIIPVEKKYTVPKIQFGSPQHQNYKQILSNKRQFTKPYADCTKYVDSLMKNKAIIRRGPFDIPLQTTFTKKPVKQMDLARKTKYSFTKTYNKFRSTTNAKKYTEPQMKKFDHTLKSHLLSYQTLFNKERNKKQDEVNLKNSMNRVLAAQMITYNLLKQSDKYSIKKKAKSNFLI